MCVGVCPRAERGALRSDGLREVDPTGDGALRSKPFDPSRGYRHVGMVQHERLERELNAHDQPPRVGATHVHRREATMEHHRTRAGRDLRVPSLAKLVGRTEHLEIVRVRAGHGAATAAAAAAVAQPAQREV
jgi:hypothetical protein